MLFTDYVQIVYIHPWSRALNDKSYNKTLCFSALAAKLNNRTPFEYFAEEDPEAWETVKTRAAKLFANTSVFRPVIKSSNVLLRNTITAMF